jgi:bacillithiol system protein YtxJ
MEQLRQIEHAHAFEELVELSHRQPVWIFKHSLTCPVSGNALGEVARFADAAPAAALYVIPVQRARPLANRVEEATGVRHESPQALLLRHGRVVWHASHWAVTSQALASAQRGAA